MPSARRPAPASDAPQVSRRVSDWPRTRARRPRAHRSRRLRRSARVRATRGRRRRRRGEAPAFEREALEPRAVLDEQLRRVNRPAQRELRERRGRIVLDEIRDVREDRGDERDRQRDRGRGVHPTEPSEWTRCSSSMEIDPGSTTARPVRSAQRTVHWTVVVAELARAVRPVIECPPCRGGGTCPTGTSRCSSSGRSSSKISPCFSQLVASGSCRPTVYEPPKTNVIVRSTVPFRDVVHVAGRRRRHVRRRLLDDADLREGGLRSSPASLTT